MGDAIIEFNSKGVPIIIYEGKYYSSEDFPLYIDGRDFGYSFVGPDKYKDKFSKLVLELDDSFEKLSGRSNSIF
jgi:hypothetical protein